MFIPLYVVSSPPVIGVWILISVTLMRNWQYLPGVKKQACVLNVSENCCFCSISLDKRSLCSDIVNDKQPSGFIMDRSIAETHC